MASKDFIQYLYWLSKSKAFNQKADEINRAIFKTSGAKPSPSDQLKELAEEYEIPKMPKEYRLRFNKLVLDRSLNNVDVHGVHEGQTQEIKATGPAIILVLKRKQTRTEFLSLWERVQILQTGKIKPHGKLKSEKVTKGIFIGQKRWSGKTDFDEVFQWYKLRKHPRSWKEVQEEVRKNEHRKGSDGNTIRTAVKRLEKVISQL